MKKNLVALSKVYDMWHKRVLSLLLAVVMVVGMIPIISLSVSAATMDITTFNSKLETFKTERYPNGSKYVNNPSLTGGYECFGFANELAVYMFGSYPTNSMSAATVNSGWTRVYGGDAVNNISVGDVVRYGFHSIFITGVSGDNIYYCQANIPSGTNKVTYDNYISRSELKTKVSKKLTSANTDKTGWVAHFVNGISTTPTPPPTPNHSCSSCVSINKTGSVTGIVNIRTAPNTSSTVICEFPTGTSVTITAKCGNWYLVKNSGGTIGWAHANYIKVKESTSSGHECSSCVSVNKSGTVKSDVNVRSGPGTSYTFLFEYYTGTDLSISMECNGWYFVSDAGGNSGWVNGNFVKVDSTHYHDYVWNYEAAHPHREYVKCSCGDYEYTGENYFDKIYSTENEYAHPHKEYKICGICGQTEYTGATRYVDSCTTCNPPHTHSYTAYHEGVHPHREYMKCSCGDYYYLDSYYYDSSCTTCNPPHTHSYTTYHDATHPHREYKKCSCGDSYYLDSYYYDSGCTTCNPPKYTITFDANGGTWSGGNLIKTHDVNVTIPNAYPTRTGYTFRGWSTSRNGTIAYFGGETYTANSSITLYAVWKSNTYTIKYNANGGSGSISNSSHTYDTAKELTANTFTRTGYIFKGWSTSASATSATYTDKQSVKNLTSVNGATVNLYAIWSMIPTYTVSYDANGGSGAPASQTKTHNVALTLSSTKPTKTGYTFKEWKTSSGVVYNPSGSYTANAGVTLVAQWNPNTYKVRFNGNGGIGDIADSTFTYDTAKTLTGNVFTKTGYTFLGWSTSASATSATYTDKQSVMNLTSTNGAIVNLYAVWSENAKYIITFDTQNTEMTISPYTKYHDEDLKLFAFTPSRTGYIFKEWLSEDGITYTSNSVYTKNKSTTLVAQWIPNTYTIKYNANGGSGSMANSSHTYDTAKELLTNAFTRNGYTFLGWSTDPSATVATYTDKQSVKNLTFKDGSTVNLYAVWGSDIITGQCGDNLTWKLDKNGVLYISGTGPMYDAKGLKGELWSDYEDRIVEVIICDGVTSIGYSAFSSHHNLISVSVADSVQCIGERAFDWSDNLTSVNIPDGITTIEKNTFNKCKNLTSIDIPDTVTQIGPYAFEKCYKLSEVTLSENLEVIGKNAFRACDSLKSIEINNNLEVIGEGAFSQSGLQSIIISSSVKSIEKDAFAYTDIESVYITDTAAWCAINFANEDANPISSNNAELYVNGELATVISFPESMMSIGNYTFYGCNSLSSVIIPDNITIIGDYAFAYCDNLSSITISDKVESIGEGSFDAYFGHTGPTVYGCKNSYAYEYAINNNIPFKSLINELLGDLNGDDEVTDSDAIYLMYHTFFPEDYLINQDCDFDGEDGVTDNDAIYLMYHTFFPEDYPLSN